MAELNLTSVPDEAWKKFIKDIADVQDKHQLMLIPTFKFNAVEGMTYEWGAMRKPPQDAKVPKTESSSTPGDTPAQE